jgi:hypothetical protein
MKNTNNKGSLFPILFMFLSVSFAFPCEPGDSLFQEKTEIFLATADIKSIEKNLELGRTNFWNITLIDEDKEVRAIFKHVDRPRPTLLPDCYKYEIAAYKLNKMLGLDVVPPVVERIVNGQKGSLQIMIENVFTDRDRKVKNLAPDDPSQFEKDLDVIKIFEILTADQCLDSADILIQEENWKVWRVDFSEAFSLSSIVPGECKIERCSCDLFDNLKNLDNGQLKKELGSYLNKEEINALCKRKQSILFALEKLIKQKGKHNVLF